MLERKCEGSHGTALCAYPQPESPIGPIIIIVQNVPYSWNLTGNRKGGNRCPECGQNYGGEPYDSAWWGMVNGRNTGAAHKMGLIYAATGEEKYAQKCAEILLAYAKYYPDYEVHGNIPYNGPGRSGGADAG